jgi:alpha,alpha-trehalose phosphorylase
LCLRLRWRDFRLTVDADHDQVTYTLRDGPDATLTIRHDGEEVELSTKSPSTVAVSSRTALLPPPEQPPGRTPIRRSAER